MKPTKTKKTEQLSYREQAILASFVFLPLPSYLRGKRASDIVTTASRVFEDAYHARSKKMWIHNVTNTCKTLVKKGYLLSQGTVTARWTNIHKLDKEEITYQSPIFALSEMGFAYVLSQMDTSCLPSVSRIQKLQKSKVVDGREELAKLFRAFLQYTSSTGKDNEELF